MSASVAKATRRDIKRAFGPEACETIQQHDTEIRALTLNANAAQEARSALEQKLSLRLDQHAATLARLSEYHKQFTQRSWWDHLCWLVLGR